MTRADDGKRSWGRQSRLLVLALVLFGLAGAIAGYRLHGTGRNAATRAEAQIRVFCTACKLEFDMPYSEYRRQSPKGTDVSGPIDCPRCGGKRCVARAAVARHDEDANAEAKDRDRRRPAAAGVQ